MIWRYRFYLSSNKKALAKFVKCINWQVSSQASQAMELIHQWAPMDVADALELLGPTFTDQGLRQYAVNRMREAPDSELQLYLLQLVQVWDTNNFYIVHSCSSKLSIDWIAILRLQAVVSHKNHFGQTFPYSI